MNFKTILAAAIFSLTSASAFAKEVKIDTKKSVINWVGKKVSGQHNGTVALKSGSVDIVKNQLKGGNFVIDMTTIKNIDLKDKEYNDKLVGHLKSDDFFGVEKNPTSNFKITSVKPSTADGNTHEISGDLTIKNITKPVTFPAKVEIKGNKATAKGKLKVDRTLYDVKYGSGKFFENLGDKMINDEFEIELDIRT